jgi:hypothetical protein
LKTNERGKYFKRAGFFLLENSSIIFKQAKSKKNDFVDFHFFKKTYSPATLLILSSFLSFSEKKSIFAF